MSNYRLAIASDHAGYDLKERLLTTLEEWGKSVRDLGPENDASVDYPDFAHPLCELVEEGEADFGVLICGSGTGMTVTANKHPQIRAANCWTAATSRSRASRASTSSSTSGRPGAARAWRKSRR